MHDPPPVKERHVPSNLVLWVVFFGVAIAVLALVPWLDSGGRRRR
jgi:quinol-cytochrome oxidoreductase complex cytochrome b subunit